MSSNKAPILLLCFDFPPNHGIGGRRWGKLAKAFAEKGHPVHVIKAQSEDNSKLSIWAKDVLHDLIQTYDIARFYPDAVKNPQDGLLGKISYRLGMRKLKKAEEGTLFDKAIGVKQELLTLASGLIQKHGIQHVIASGAPFNIPYYSSFLKDTFPKITLLCDYRDMWIESLNYGMSTLPPERMALEIAKQDRLFEKADFITCPNDFLLEEIKQTASPAAKIKAQFLSIPHYYDPADAAPTKAVPASDDLIRINYGGAVYVGMEKTLEQIKLVLDRLEKEDKGLYQRVRMNFYSDTWAYYKNVFGHHNVVQLGPSIGSEIKEVYQQSDAIIISLSESYKNYLTTKFFENLLYKKPYLYLGPRGHAANYIEQNKLGVCWDGSYEHFVSILNKLTEKAILTEPISVMEGNNLATRAAEVIDILGIS